MASLLCFDGQYASAQLEKLDWCCLFKGRHVHISEQIVEFLMRAKFPSARFEAWARQYQRLPDSSMRVGVCMRLVADEDLPDHLSDHARIRCKVVRMEGEHVLYINYSGTTALYLAQREALFGTSVPSSIMVNDHLTDEELEYLSMWRGRYGCPWPFVHGEWNASINERYVDWRAHEELRALRREECEHFRKWCNAAHRGPDEDEYYIRWFYVDGALKSEVRNLPPMEVDEEN